MSEWGVEIPDMPVKNYRRHDCAVGPTIIWSAIYCIEDDSLTLGRGEYNTTIHFCPWCGKPKEEIAKETGGTFQAYHWSPGEVKAPK